MHVSPKNQNERDIEDLMQIIKQLEAARAADPKMQSAQAGDLLRYVPDRRAVFEGEFKGAPAVFRIFMGKNGQVADREWAEMMRLWPHMSDGDYRIAKPLYYCASHKIIVVENVPGTPLLIQLRGCPISDRTPYLLAAANWLKKSVCMSENSTPDEHAYWLKRAHDASARQPFDQHKQLETGILQDLTRLSTLMDARPWRSAITHGDFHPNNLISQGSRLTAIDTGSSKYLLVYKDIARFLVHMGRRDLRIDGGQIYGVSQSGFAAFSQVFELSDYEMRLCLPFMIGIEAVIRIENLTLSSSRIRRAAKFYMALLDDLRKAI